MVKKKETLEERVAKLLPKWQKGVNGIRLADLDWEGKNKGYHYGKSQDGEEYVYLDGCYYDLFDSYCDATSEYIDHDRLKYDIQKMMQDDLPDCKVKINWHCNEVEILTCAVKETSTSKSSSKTKTGKPKK